LMDIHMPVMNGIEASRAIRNLPGPEARIPIISLTASIATPDLQALEPLNICARLTKPIDEQQLIQAVRQACLDEPIVAAHPASGNQRLSRYGISDARLSSELQQQVCALQTAFAQQDSVQMRDHSHQLMGLAGLLGMNELDRFAQAFNLAVKQSDDQAIALHLRQLQRLVAESGESAGG
ncbi:MAG TPA: response regulator, partial [Motiliproteus sp.]